MGKYNFDEIINRRNSWSLKWEVADNELPMWVADMDFKAAPEIIKAFEERISLGAYGYTTIPDEWYDAYISWWGRRHKLKIEKDELIFSSGVIPTLSSTIRKLTTANEKVLIQTPVYNVFYNSILNNGVRVVENPLTFKNNRWEMDFEDLEAKLSDPETSLMLLCNPQNPAGRIWLKDELARVGELCKKYGVTVISDEIHCDLTNPEMEYVPFAGASDTCREISINCFAPSKIFNLAGMQSSAVFVPNKFLRHKVWRALNTDECGEPNFLAITAAVAAFNNGENWLNELNVYIRQNKDYVEKFVAENIPSIHVLPSEATYLQWIDCREITNGKNDLAGFIRHETGLYLSAGEIYGASGSGFLRLNTACPLSLVKDGMNRLKAGIEAYISK